MNDIGTYANLGAIGAIIALFAYMVTKHLPAIQVQIKEATAGFLDAIAKQRGEHLNSANIQQERYLRSTQEQYAAFSVELKQQRIEFLDAIQQQRLDYIAATERQRADSITALQEQTVDFNRMFNTTAQSLIESMRINILELLRK